jgi:hypothetical protein
MGHSQDLPPEQRQGLVRDHAPQQEWQDAQKEGDGERKAEE